MKAPPRGHFSLRAAADHSGLSSYMVEYLCRIGVVDPSGTKVRGRGRPRYFSFGDVVMLRTITRLLESGISPTRLRNLFADLRKFHPEIANDGNLPGKFLCADSKSVFFITDTAVENLNKNGQQEFRFMIDVNLMRYEVNKRIMGGRRSIQRDRPVRKASQSPR